MQYGIVYFTVNGVRYSVRGNFTITPEYRRGEPIPGPDGSLTFSKVFVPAAIGGDVAMPDAITLKELAGLSGVNVSLSCDNGKIYSLSSASQVEELSFNPEDGAVTVRFVGTKLDEL